MTIRPQNISLRGLRTFCAAAELESFRDAADKLFITASAVSHQIRNLEDELGQKLFDRNPRSLSLTEAGRILYADIRPIVEQLDDVAARHKRSAPRSALRISVQPFFASEMFVPRLQDFMAEHPEIDIKVDTSDESAEKHPGNADVSIRVFKSTPANLSYDRLFSLRLIPAASAAFRKNLKLKGQQVVSDFPVIVHDSRPKAWKQWQTSSGIKLPTEANAVYLDSMIAVARAAERGLGAALVPVQLIDGWFKARTLVPLFDHELATDDAYYFVCSRADSKQDAVKLLREWVLENFGGTA